MQQILVVSFANYILVKINLSGKTIKIFGNSNNKTRTHKHHFKHTLQTAYYQ